MSELRKRFEKFRDKVGVPVSKVAEKCEIDPVHKLYNFVAGSSLKDDDAVNLHKYLEKYDS